jgi:hypothetical protein
VKSFRAKAAELIWLVQQLLTKVDQLQKQVDAHSGALDYMAKAIFYCTLQLQSHFIYLSLVNITS